MRLRQTVARWMCVLWVVGCGEGAVIEGPENESANGSEWSDSPADLWRNRGARDARCATADAGVSTDAAAVSASPLAAKSDVLHAEGRYLLDTCGQRWMARGMEQLTAKAFSVDQTMPGIARELAASGSNAVRILPTISEITPDDLDTLLRAFAAHQIVVYISPGDLSWFARSDIKPVLMRHEKGLILDAYQEPNHADENRWVQEAQAAIATVRAAGYRCPLTVLAPGFGRQLGMAIKRGQEIVNADPQHNTIIGWQAYWGSSDVYQKEAGMSLSEGVSACAAQPFPMQLGIDLFSDPGETMNYAEAMAAAETHGVGWLWWNWWNQWDGMGNNISRDGSYANLTEVGETVVRGDENSIQKTARKACFR